MHKLMQTWRSLLARSCIVMHAYQLRLQERKSHGVLGAPKPCVELAAADSDAAPPPREEHSLAEQCRKAPGARN